MKRATTVVAGFIFMIAGLPFSPLLFIFGLALIIVAFFMSPSDAVEGDGRVVSSSVIEYLGVTWMRQGDGVWLRWNPDGEAWEATQPPPPAAIVALDPRSSRFPTGGTIVAVSLVILGLLFVWALGNPHVQIPVVSKIACSLKGASWDDGSPALGIPAGCYERPPAEDDLFKEPLGD